MRYVEEVIEDTQNFLEETMDCFSNRKEKAPLQIVDSEKGQKIDDASIIKKIVTSNECFEQKVLICKNKKFRKNYGNNKSNVFYARLIDVLNDSIKTPDGKQWSIQKAIDAINKKFPFTEDDDAEFIAEQKKKRKLEYPVLILGQLREDGDTSKEENRDRWNDIMGDLCMIDIDIHPEKGDLSIDLDKLIKQAFSLGCMAVQKSARGHGLHILFEYKGRGEAFNKVLNKSMQMADFDRAKEVYSKIYTEAINAMTPILLEGQKPEVIDYYSKQPDSDRKNCRYRLCDGAVKSYNRAAFLTVSDWIINEQAHPYVVDDVHTHSTPASDIWKCMHNGFDDEQQMAVVEALHSKVDKRSMLDLQKTNAIKKYNRWEGFKYLDTLPDINEAAKVAEAKVRKDIELGQEDGNGHFLCRPHGSIANPIELEKCNLLKAKIPYKCTEGGKDKTKYLSLYEWLNDSNLGGLDYANAHDKIYCTYDAIPEGSINLLPPIPDYKLIEEENANVELIKNFLLKKSSMWTYAAQTILKALKTPNRPSGALIYLFEPKGGAGKSLTMDAILSKLGGRGFVAPVRMVDSEKYSDALPKAKIWLLQEAGGLGGKEADFQRQENTIKMWTGDKEFPLEMKYGKIVECKNCPILIASINDIETVPLGLLSNRRMLPVPYTQDALTTEEIKVFEDAAETFSTDEVYTALSQIASMIGDFSLKDNFRDAIPIDLWDARRSVIKHTLQCIPAASSLMDGLQIEDLKAMYNLRSLKRYASLIEEYKLKDDNAEFAF